VIGSHSLSSMVPRHTDSHSKRSHKISLLPVLKMSVLRKNVQIIYKSHNMNKTD